MQEAHIKQLRSRGFAGTPIGGGMHKSVGCRIIEIRGGRHGYIGQLWHCTDARVEGLPYATKVRVNILNVVGKPAQFDQMVGYLESWAENAGAFPEQLADGPAWKYL